MQDIKVYDYDDVRVFVDDKYVAYEQEVFDPDLSFNIGTLRSELPLVLYYEDRGGDSRMEEVCAKYGVITAGAACSKIPLPQNPLEEICDGKDPPGYKLYERFDPLRVEHVREMRVLTDESHALIVGCSAAARHALAVANELRLATAVLVGPTQSKTTKLIESIGLTVPRVTLVEQISRATDVPVIATASNSSDVCKALVAGANAALIHLGGPFELNDDLDFVVKTVTDMVRSNLTELCLSSGAKNVNGLAIRCKLVPR